MRKPKSTLVEHLYNALITHFDNSKSMALCQVCLELKKWKAESPKHIAVIFEEEYAQHIAKAHCAVIEA